MSHLRTEAIMYPKSQTGEAGSCRTMETKKKEHAPRDPPLRLGAASSLSDLQCELDSRGMHKVLRYTRQ